MEYIEVSFGGGATIDDALRILNQYEEAGVSARGEFNGVMLYSGMGVDRAYTAVVGKGKAEFDEEVRAAHARYEAEEAEHKRAIPDKIKLYQERGREVFSKSVWELWDKMVPVRLDDLYRGMELDACLEIGKILNAGEPLANAKAAMFEQGHSGMSHSLVCSMILHLCKRGPKFVEFVNR